jgi:hypothetical protein
VTPDEAVSVFKAGRFVCVHLVEHRLLYLVDDVRLVVSEFEALIMFFGCVGALFSAVQRRPVVGDLARDGIAIQHVAATGDPRGSDGRMVSRTGLLGGVVRH